MAFGSHQGMMALECGDNDTYREHAPNRSPIRYLVKKLEKDFFCIFPKVFLTLTIKTILVFLLEALPCFFFLV
jgi:hypothetical protein